MLQGAIALYRAATGDRKLLDAGIRFVDDFLIPKLWSRRQTRRASSQAIQKIEMGAGRALPHHW